MSDDVRVTYAKQVYCIILGDLHQNKCLLLITLTHCQYHVHVRSDKVESYLRIMSNLDKPVLVEKIVSVQR